MSGREPVRAQCTRCGNSLITTKQEYQREGGQVYCDECLVPFQCDVCGERKYTIPENISETSSLTCRDCAQKGQQSKGGNSGRASQCTICGKQKRDLIEYREAPGEPVCQDCAPTAENVIRESQTGILDAVVSGIGHLLGMAVYLVFSLGVAAYVVGAFDLVWWMFFLTTAVLLLVGAENSKIFEPRELVDLGYATVAMFIAVWLVLGSQNFDNTILIGSMLILGLVIHELSHKAIGLGFGKPARFSAFHVLNLVSVGVAYLSGFLFLLPGAVKYRAVTERVHGIVAAAGPVSNIVLALIFLALAGQYPEISRIGVLLNTILAGFNMLPIPPLDGSKVIKWSWGAYLFIAGFVALFGYQLFIA
jgi:Zn-dependent protease